MKSKIKESASGIILFLMLVFIPTLLFSQGPNHAWLLGFDGWADKGRMLIDNSSYAFTVEQRKMGFEGTEATICDPNGNFLMSSNGVWIANANNDTMMNGSGLNPGTETAAYPEGLLLPDANIFLPYPGDSTKYVLFHHTCEWDGFSYPAYEVFYSVIDMTLDGGLGGVVSNEKNVIAFQDTLNWGITACKHANGRDWWVVAIKNNSDLIYKILFTPNGIESISFQNLNVPIAWYSITNAKFSPDGNKFSYVIYDTASIDNSVLIFDFDRCTGLFSNEQVIPVTTGIYLWGLAFSPSGKYVYTCSSGNIFQIDTDNLTVDTVATYDNFCYPNPPWCTTFFMMYLAANGKIYITSGNGVQHLHEINYPDSAGIACDVQQHTIFLNIWTFRAVPNHPNYYLSAVDGSVCDSLGINQVNEISLLENAFKIFPNPNDGNFSIRYLLSQNKSGIFEMFDVNGRMVYTMPLPQWSTLQQVNIPDVSEGLYNCVISSGNARVSKKIAIINE